MPVFQYKATSRTGQKKKGMIETNNLQDAYQRLREQGLYVSSIAPYKESVWKKEIELGGNKVKSQHFVVFCRQFATLIRAGIGVVDAVKVLSEQTESKVLKKTLESVLAEIRTGTQLSAACMEHPKVFSSIFINMVRAGEASGNLDDVLEKLASFFEKEHGTREKIKSALTYPITVSIIAVLVTGFLMWKVVPQFVSTFEGLGIQLPLVTRIVMGISNSVIGYWYLYLAFPFFIFFLIKWYGKTDSGRYRLDYLKLKMPIFGKLLQKTAMARFSRTFSSLFAAAVPMLQILNIVSNVVGNEVITRTIEKSKEHLRSGQSLTGPLKENWVFPPMVVQMMAVGEQTGTLDSILEKVADFYEAEVDAMADRLKSLLEPLLIVVMAGIVGMIVLAILLPTFTLYSNL
ncbi:type II secretion system F family protein [Microaerobacter geothermalis]|uniref:type II secretion system F family protein n=1 Tax=Microaerobacter geothermalis TaxID=674972 RepID=UPI001F1FF719|nr:type II secretion system F family protein [Microaerobacter geothermalis]MCF6092697.1 type II secretion system F family protein [Microaerobacter geothermalis]